MVEVMVAAGGWPASRDRHFLPHLALVAQNGHAAKFESFAYAMTGSVS
jgi:hypothetical protein